MIEKFLAINSNFIQEEFMFTDSPELDGFFIAKLRKFTIFQNNFLSVFCISF